MAVPPANSFLLIHDGRERNIPLDMAFTRQTLANFFKLEEQSIMVMGNNVILQEPFTFADRGVYEVYGDARQEVNAEPQEADEQQLPEIRRLPRRARTLRRNEPYGRPNNNQDNRIVQEQPNVAAAVVEDEEVQEQPNVAVDVVEDEEVPNASGDEGDENDGDEEFVNEPMVQSIKTFIRGRRTLSGKIVADQQAILVTLRLRAPVTMAFIEGEVKRQGDFESDMYVLNAQFHRILDSAATSDPSWWTRGRKLYVIDAEEYTGRTITAGNEDERNRAEVQELIRRITEHVQPDIIAQAFMGYLSD